MNDVADSSLIPHPSSLPRVAIIHDWLTGMRGGEAVLEAILELFPDAELFTLFHFPGSVSEAIERRTIHTSSLQRMASRAGDYRNLLPLYPRAIREFDLRRFDLVISSSHCVAKGVEAHGKPHVCYCHTPMRYIWDRFDDYFPRSKPARRAVARIVAARLRRWDVASSRGVTRFVANSRFVAERIRRYYDRDAAIVHPFVDDAFLDVPLPRERGEHHVVVSALVPYKHVELAVAAAEAARKPLVVIGGGPLLERLSARASPNVRFLGHVSRETVIQQVGSARSLILPGIEDFGITPLEAMALGTPVVALGEGGVLDSVVPGGTGIFFDTPEVDSLRRAIVAAEERDWDRQQIRTRAAEFSRGRFLQEFAGIVRQVSA